VIALLLRAGASPSLAALGGLAAAAAIGLLIGAMVVGRVGAVGALAGGALLAWAGAARLGTPLALALGVGAALALFLLARRFLPRLELSPFIVTLGLWGALRGLAKGLAQNQPVYPESLGWIEGLMQSGGGSRAFLAPGVWILFGLALLVAVLLGSTVLGRHVVAVGSSEATARLCGVRVERVKVLVYVLGVGCAGVAALLQLSFLSIGDPTTAGGLELRVIAAVVIGGASLSGGEGTIRGTLVGALIMVVVDNGCTKLGLENWVQEVVTGAIIVAAVALDRARHLRG
jgi:ribose transport system permease protein